MIYDCFIFFNELELLDLRLHELDGVADKFVLVESTRTFSNQPKPLHFQENRARFAEFASRIIHVVVDDAPDAGHFAIEKYQRNAIARGLRGARPDDWVLLSDVDEIPRAATVARVSREEPFNAGWPARLGHAALNSKLTQAVFRWKACRRLLRNHHPFILKFEQTLHRHYLNCVSVRPRYWWGPRMLRYRDFSTAEEVRYSGRRVIADGGWHFTFMGGAERIRDKIQAYSHTEFNQPKFTDPAAIGQRIDRGDSLFGQDEQLEFVPLDDSFPRYLLEHPGKFSSWIKPLPSAKNVDSP
jgi:beta-1,4-mannosyl-glycoprotein beta-1,4-N-acetylglucosaminyltransferase